MNTQNPYEALKVDSVGDATTVEAQFSRTVTDDADEKVMLLLAHLPDGLWAYGYRVYWRNGRISLHEPSAALGRFRSQREALLYAVGFMLMFTEYFTPATCEALRRAQGALSQTQLF